MTDRKARMEFELWTDESLINLCLKCAGVNSVIKVERTSDCRECPVRYERVNREIGYKCPSYMTADELDATCDILCTGSIGCHDCIIGCEKEIRARDACEENTDTYGVFISYEDDNGLHEDIVLVTALDEEDACKIVKNLKGIPESDDNVWAVKTVARFVFDSECDEQEPGIVKGGGFSRPSWMSDEEYSEYKMTPGYKAEISRCDPPDEDFDEDFDEGW